MKKKINKVKYIMDAKTIFDTIQNAWLEKDIEKALKSFSVDDDYNIFNRSGDTPLTVAIKNRSLSFVKKLLECGADINFLDKKGKTPLIHAYENAKLSSITLLLFLNKANPNVYDNNILVRAVQWNDEKTVQLLIDTYPNIDLNSKMGGAIPIIVDCCGYCDEITQILCLASKDEKQINNFREQLKQVTNDKLLQSKDRALKILDSLSLKLSMEDSLVNKSHIKNIKI